MERGGENTGASSTPSKVYSRTAGAWQGGPNHRHHIFASIAAPDSLSIVRISDIWEMQKRGQGRDEISRRLKLIRSKRLGADRKVGQKWAKGAYVQHPLTGSEI